MGGPIPKRSDQRRRRNKSAVPIVTAPAGSRVPVPAPDPDPNWAPMVRRWFQSLGESGQSVFFEPSDWASAAIWAEVLDRALAQGDRPSPGLVAAWLSGSGELLATEGSRRRMRIELERGSQVDEDSDAAVAALDQYRRRLSPNRLDDGA